MTTNKDWLIDWLILSKKTMKSVWGEERRVRKLRAARLRKRTPIKSKACTYKNQKNETEQRHKPLHQSTSYFVREISFTK